MPWSGARTTVQQVANVRDDQWVFACMTIKLLSTLVVVAALAVVPAAASAAEPARTPAPVADSQGIIAILIGLAAQPFTPPIGTDKGS